MTPAEAQQLVEWFANRAGDGNPDPGPHMHITDEQGRELTIGVSGDAVFYRRRTMAKKLTIEQRKRIAALLGEIQNDLAEMRALLEKRLGQRRA